MKGNCYAMTCKRRIRIGHSCIPHAMVVGFSRVMKVLSLGRWPYDWTYWMMGRVYRAQDRRLDKMLAEARGES